MAKLKISNNAVSRLSANISPADTSISLLPGGGASFPSLATDDWFPATIVKADGSLEIVRVTARATDVLTVVRAQEATAAIAFSAGDRVEHRFTAAAFTEENARVEAIAQDALDTVSTSVDDLTASLAGDSGSTEIGNGGETVAQSFNALQLSDYAAVRSYVGPRKSIYLTGYIVSAAPSGKAGTFVRDSSDTSSVDNGGTVIVSSNGVRWKRQYEGAVDIRWFGAISAENEAGFDSTAAIVAAKAVADAANQALLIANGKYNCSAVITINTSNMIIGNGQEASKIRFTGAGNLQSNRLATQDFVELRYFSIERAPSGTANIGLDIGTLRRAIVDTVYVRGFKIGVSQDMGVELVANYWNRLFNVTAECTGQEAAGSVGFLFGNNVHTSYPDTDYNNMVGCKSFVCETAILGVNMIGCKIIGHQCTVVGTALNLISGNNNHIQLVAENCFRMGGASALTHSNHLDLYNDGNLAVPFNDLGWNFHSGQILTQQRLANDSREIDSFIKDRINVVHTLATRGVFIVTTSADNAAYTVTTTCCGYISGVSGISCIQVWDVRRISGETPVVTLVRTTGTSPLYTDVAANGEVLWSVNGNAESLSVLNITVNIEGFSTPEANPFAQLINYKRAEGL